jgi:competence protein ComEC
LRKFEKIFVIFATTALLGLGIYLQKPNTTNKVGAEVSFLNVGQGDSTLIKTPNNKYVLIDGGPDKKILSELGEILPPTEKEISTVVLTHPHADHVAGLNYVLDRYRVGEIYLTGVNHNAPDYTDFLERIKEQNIPVHKAYLGQPLVVDGVKFDIIYPLTDISGQNLKDQNDGSVVMDVSYEGKHILMLSDLSAKIQEKVGIWANIRATNTILKVSHHGSKTGTSSRLFDLLRPKYSVISVGSKNYFGHPAPLTLAQLAGSIIKRTDQDGRIQFLINSSGVTLE